VEFLPVKNRILMSSSFPNLVYQQLLAISIETQSRGDRHSNLNWQTDA